MCDTMPDTRRVSAPAICLSAPARLPAFPPACPPACPPTFLPPTRLGAQSPTRISSAFRHACLLFYPQPSSLFMSAGSSPACPCSAANICHFCLVQRRYCRCQPRVPLIGPRLECTPDTTMTCLCVFGSNSNCSQAASKTIVMARTTLCISATRLQTKDFAKE